MAELLWDVPNKKFYYNGIDKTVLFTSDGMGGWNNGVAWEGITNVMQKPTGAETTPLWANNQQYATMVSPEGLEGSIEAYEYPDAWATVDGSAAPFVGVHLGQQSRKAFCIAYRSRIHSEGGGEEIGHKYHIIYNCLASPSEKTYATINEKPDATTFKWDFKSTAVSVAATTGLKNYRNVCSVMIDTRTADPAKVTALEEMLFGTIVDNSTLPTLADLETIFGV